jgi:hypothetical protein
MGLAGFNSINFSVDPYRSVDCGCQEGKETGLWLSVARENHGLRRLRRQEIIPGFSTHINQNQASKKCMLACNKFAVNWVLLRSQNKHQVSLQVANDVKQFMDI